MADTRNGFDPPPFTPRWDQATRNTQVPRQPGHAADSQSYAPPVWGETPAAPFRPAGPRHSSGGYAEEPRFEQVRPREERPAGEPPKRTGRLDKNPWHWLLLIPIVLPLMPVIYNRIEPTLFGIPFFYWGQLAFAFLASAVIAIVNMMDR